MPRKILRTGLIYFLLLQLAGVCWLRIFTSPGYSYIYILALCVELSLLEAFFPKKPEWGLDRASVVRDFKVFFLSSCAVNLTRFGITPLILYFIAAQPGKLHPQSFNPGPLLAFILVYEFIKYWHHRYRHEFKDPVAKFFWRLHASHHAPERFYSISAILRHPFDQAINLAVIPYLLYCLIPISFYDFHIFYMFTVTMACFSHLNMETNSGFMNYIFVTPETHVFHHSTKPEEAKNYGVSLALFDVIFGTFVYKRQETPDRLGLIGRERIPRLNEISTWLFLPFTGRHQRL